MSERTFSAAELAEHLGARLVGDGDVRLAGLAPIDTARPGDLTHLSSPAWRRCLDDCLASAVLVTAADAPRVPTTALVVDDPYLAYARASRLFDDAPPVALGRSPDATVDATAELGEGVTLGPGARIGAGVRIGADSHVGPNAVIGAGAVLGRACEIHAGAVLCHGVVLGDRCIIHPNAVIGGDGFGFARAPDGRSVGIAQLGTVRLGDDVEVGAGTTIDRGAIGDTEIADGVKIDNQVQIGHNVRIGRDTVVCGCTGIVGSSVIGAHCVLAGGVGVGGDGPVHIADGTVVSGMTHVSRSIDAPGVYSSGSLAQPTRRWKRNAIRLMALDELARRVAALERERAGPPEAADGEP